MPRAEEDNSPRGLPPGAEQQLQTESQVAPDQSPAAQFAGAEAGATGATSPVAVPLESTVNQPAPPEQDQKFVPGADLQEQQQDNTLPNGMNLDDGLYSPTQRPGEEVTAGGSTTPQQTPVSQMLTGLQQSVQSPDVAALLHYAQQKGM